MSKYNPQQFDDIRPYYDSEIPAAMERIVNSDFFGLLCTYVYPGKNPEDVKKMMLSDALRQRAGDRPFHDFLHV